MAVEPSAAAPVTLAMLLNRWARHAAVGTVDAAVAWLGVEHGVALLALVKPLTGVGRHRFQLAVAANRAGQRRLQHVGGHCEPPCGWDG